MKEQKHPLMGVKCAADIRRALRALGMSPGQLEVQVRQQCRNRNLPYTPAMPGEVVARSKRRR